MGLAIQKGAQLVEAQKTPKSPLRLVSGPNAPAKTKSPKLVPNRLSPEAVEARNNLIESHIETAHKLAANLLKRWNARLPREEVQSLANIALCEAAARFDDSRGVKFVTYLFFFIKGQLGVAITSSVNDQKGTQFSYVPGEAVPTPEDELNLKRAANKLAKERQGMCAVTGAVADELIFNDQAGVGELAGKLGRARETISRAKTAATETLLNAWRAA